MINTLVGYTMNQTFLTISRTTQTDKTRMSDDSFSEKTEEVKS